MCGPRNGCLRRPSKATARRCTRCPSSIRKARTASRSPRIARTGSVKARGRQAFRRCKCGVLAHSGPRRRRRADECKTQPLPARARTRSAATGRRNAVTARIAARGWDRVTNMRHSVGASGAAGFWAATAVVASGLVLAAGAHFPALAYSGAQAEAQSDPVSDPYGFPNIKLCCEHKKKKSARRRHRRRRRLSDDPDTDDDR